MQLRDLLIGGVVGLSGWMAAHPSPCPGRAALFADFLYLLPSVDYTYYVFETPTAAQLSGTYINNDFNFSPGFRVGGIYSFCQCDRQAEVSYTRLSVEQSSQTVGSFLDVTAPTFGLGAGDSPPRAGDVQVTLDLLYQRADAWLTNPCILAYSDLKVDLLGGVAFAYIRLNEDLDFFTPTGLFTAVHEQSKTWGIGPQLGGAFDYHICSFSSCGCESTFLLHGMASGSFLTSKLIRNVSEDFVSINVARGPYTFDDTWKVVPAFYARFGLDYAVDFSCLSASLEVGYEYHLYLNALARYDYEAAGTIGALITDFDAQGLYISVAATF